jgi:hypothetical protein
MRRRNKSNASARALLVLGEQVIGYSMVELPHFCVLSINTDMALEIPVHLQQQFPFVIHELQGIIDKEGYQSLLKIPF